MMSFSQHEMQTILGAGLGRLYKLGITSGLWLVSHPSVDCGVEVLLLVNRNLRIHPKLLDANKNRVMCSGS